MFFIVFFHLCYEGAVDLDTIQDINDRHGLEVQIMEFGQIPKKVFTLPHPKRLTSTIDLFSKMSLGSEPIELTKNENDGNNEFSLKQTMVLTSHKEAVSNIKVMNNAGDDVASVGHDGVLKIYSLKTGKLTRSITLSYLPLSSCIYYQTSLGQNILVVGSWDNNL